jgi:hypothetical protein
MGMENLVVADDGAPVAGSSRFHVVQNRKEDCCILESGYDLIAADNAWFKRRDSIDRHIDEHTDI